MRPVGSGNGTGAAGGGRPGSAQWDGADAAITRASCAGFASIPALTSSLLRSNFRKRRTDRHFGADVDQKLFNLACLEDFDLDRPFLRFHHGDDVATLDTIAWLDQPLDECSGFHIGTKRGHAKFSHRRVTHVASEQPLSPLRRFSPAAGLRPVRGDADRESAPLRCIRARAAHRVPKNACSTIRVQISAEMLPLRHPSSTMMARRVLLTDAMIVASSSGRKLRRSMTSASMFSAASRLAASSVFHSEPP